MEENKVVEEVVENTEVVENVTTDGVKESSLVTEDVMPVKVDEVASKTTEPEIEEIAVEETIVEETVEESVIDEPVVEESIIEEPVVEETFVDEAKEIEEEIEAVSEETTKFVLEEPSKAIPYETLEISENMPVEKIEKRKSKLFKKKPKTKKMPSRSDAGDSELTTVSLADLKNKNKE